MYFLIARLTVTAEQFDIVLNVLGRIACKAEECGLLLPM